MRVVIDTNVLVSGIFWSGAPARILDLWVKDSVKAIVSRPILVEYERVIRELSKDASPALAGQWLMFIMQHAIIVEAPVTVYKCSDPHDNKFIDCAVAGDAHFLISGDRALLTLGKVSGTQVVSPAQFLKHIAHKRL